MEEQKKKRFRTIKMVPARQYDRYGLNYAIWQKTLSQIYVSKYGLNFDARFVR
jgi:hypothetical protein